MDSTQYCQISEDGLTDSTAMHLDETWMLMQDNAPVHTSGFAKDFLETKNIQVMNWPSKSPNFKSIEIV